MKNTETNQNLDKNFQIKPIYNQQNETPSQQSNTHPFSNFRQQNIEDNLVSKITGDDGNISFEILDDDKEESKRSFQINQGLENTGTGNQKRLDKIQTALIPTNPLILIIDLFVFFIIMLELWTIPIRFGVKEEEINFYMVDYFQEFGILAIFLKMCFSINTGIFIGGLITLQRDKIVEQYIKRFLLIDILCIVALVVKQRYFSLIFFFQYPRIKLITQAMDMYLQLSTKFQTIAKILNLIFLILVVAHISACGFLWITIVDKDQSESWIISTQLQEANWDKRYLNAVYFMIITMSTIGYGDVSPVTVYEKIYGIVISLIACGIFGFAINMIGTIFQEKAQREADYVYNRQQALKFMQIRNISKEGQTKVLKFLEHQFNQESLEGNLQKGQSVINSVSKNLQEEIYKEFYFPILKKCEIIPTYFSLKFVEKLCLLMRETNFSEGENIYSSETEAQQHLYYVIKGNIQVYDNLSTKVKGLIESGSFFGYNYFFLDTYPINEVLRSETDSQILYIKRQDFLSLLDEFPKEKENYTQVQNKILNQEGKFQKCVFCHTFDHNSQFCSLVHYRYFRDKERIRAEIRFQSLQGKKFYRYDAIDIRRDLIELDKEYKKLSEIFDEMDEDDDEIVLKLRPSIQFPLVDGQEYNMIKIQPLTEFLEENQNNQYNDLYPDFSAINTDDQVEQLQIQTFQGSIASLDKYSQKPQPFRQKKSKIKSNQTNQSILMIQNVMRESMAQSRQFKSITNKITNYSTTNINNQIPEIVQNQQQQHQPQIPLLCLNCQKQEQKQKIQIVDQYQKDEIEKEKMQILPDLDKVETFKVFKKWNNIDNVLASHKKYIQKLKEKRESQQQSNFNLKNKLQIRKNGISTSSKSPKKTMQIQSKFGLFQNPKSNSQQIQFTYEKSQQNNKNKTDNIKENAYLEESDVSNIDLKYLQNLQKNINRQQKSDQKNIYNIYNQENSVNESISELKNIQSSNLYINQNN
ncbi:Cyclic nucleotide-binding protein [Pseudocohnilembus persalinus]|uniref:Cyclic nucleotide-binding protein n=1 Tax=Pseudocohnilembus persalinus TaxID=266149 RepID=A0A0V0QSC1_PSEPJ|nr:Cyclic nucleotide-binding protein [Pseudocohnilembus persalinus]|eukprot:KRX04888.1 Cyclic nucleotide-binding protein [Pseudocohnilembus persalinus]